MHKPKPFTIRGEYMGIGSGEFTPDGATKAVAFWNFQLAVIGGTWKFKKRNVAEDLQKSLPVKAGGLVDVLVEIRPDKEGEPVLYVLNVVPVEPPAANSPPVREPAGASR